MQLRDIFLVEDEMLFGDNVCIMGIIRTKDNAIYAFRDEFIYSDNSSLSIGIIRVYGDISRSISSH